VAYRLILSLLAALIVSPAHADITGTPRVDDGDTLKISGERAVAKAMKFWYGNIHAHTSEDSGENNIPESTHEEAFLYAMDDTKGNLDFLAITPHNHLVKKRSYKNLQITTNDPNTIFPASLFLSPGKSIALSARGTTSTFLSWTLGLINTQFRMESLRSYSMSLFPPTKRR
jgi:hypothetical protein